MKYIFLIGLFVLAIVQSLSSQSWIKKINDEDYLNRISKGLKVGDKMPDLSLGKVINVKMNEKKFSDFKGKLVILDFWNSWCSACIASFPKMEKLQKEFGNEIQIILLNPIEDSLQLSKKRKKYKLPDLPCIVKDSNGYAQRLWELFPSKSAGHQVWIDKEGNVCLRGASLNTNSKKIRNILDGKKVFILSDDGTTPSFDPAYPYMKLLPDLNNYNLQFTSLITEFNNEYSTGNSGHIERYTDSISGNIRYTYINKHFLYLFSVAFGDYLLKARDKILYGPFLTSNQGLFGYNVFSIPSDTINYTSEFGKINNDEDFVRSKFCYEQILPINVSDSQRRNYMLQDLNRYFINKNGTNVSLLQKHIPCFILKRERQFDLQTKYDQYSCQDTAINGVKGEYYKYACIDIITDLIRKNKKLVSLFANNYFNNKPFLLLNESGITRQDYIDIVLPDVESINTIEELNFALSHFGLTISEEIRDIGFIEISKKD